MAEDAAPATPPATQARSPSEARSPGGAPVKKPAASLSALMAKSAAISKAKATPTPKPTPKPKGSPKAKPAPKPQPKGSPKPSRKRPAAAAAAKPAQPNAAAPKKTAVDRINDWKTGLASKIAKPGPVDDDDNKGDEEGDEEDVQEEDECIDPDTFEVEDNTDKAKKTKDRRKWAKFKMFLAQKSLPENIVKQWTATLGMKVGKQDAQRKIVNLPLDRKDGKSALNLTKPFFQNRKAMCLLSKN